MIGDFCCEIRIVACVRIYQNASLSRIGPVGERIDSAEKLAEVFSEWFVVAFVRISLFFAPLEVVHQAHDAHDQEGSAEPSELQGAVDWPAWSKSARMLPLLWIAP
jgi:hypothetical protein